MINLCMAMGVQLPAVKCSYTVGVIEDCILTDYTNNWKKGKKERNGNDKHFGLAFFKFCGSHSLAI